MVYFKVYCKYISKKFIYLIVKISCSQSYQYDRERYLCTPSNNYSF